MNIDSNTVQKYRKQSVAALLKRAAHYCHKYIRERDKHLPCISCSQFRTLEAGHYHPGGTVKMLRFNEFNVNGECKQCNYFSGDHLIHYRANLIRKVGQDKVDELDIIAAYNKRVSEKWERIHLIEIIEYYRYKLKEL